ncbi:hypothetical protein Q7P37_006674 [Cladosporium fusiforme]
MFIECKVSTSNVNNGMACLEITSTPTYPEDQGHTLAPMPVTFTDSLREIATIATKLKIGIESLSPLVTYSSFGTYDIDLLLGQHAVRTLQLQGLGFTPYAVMLLWNASHSRESPKSPRVAHMECVAFLACAYLDLWLQIRNVPRSRICRGTSQQD